MSTRLSTNSSMVPDLSQSHMPTQFYPISIKQDLSASVEMTKGGGELLARFGVKEEPNEVLLRKAGKPPPEIFPATVRVRGDFIVEFPHNHETRLTLSDQIDAFRGGGSRLCDGRGHVAVRDTGSRDLPPDGGAAI